MKRLVVVRHAKSSWQNPSQRDFDRPLNGRGKRDAPVLGQRLAAWGLAPDLILSSPARRARKTAAALAKALDYPADEIEFDPAIYEADVVTLLHRVRCLDEDDGVVLLVGHNPGCTELCTRLTGRAIANLPTCAAAELQFDFPVWSQVGPDSGTLLRLDTPKQPAA